MIRNNITSQNNYTIKIIKCQIDVNDIRKTSPHLSKEVSLSILQSIWGMGYW